MAPKTLQFRRGQHTVREGHINDFELAYFTCLARESYIKALFGPMTKLVANPCFSLANLTEYYQVFDCLLLGWTLGHQILDNLQPVRVPLYLKYYKGLFINDITHIALHVCHVPTVFVVKVSTGPHFFRKYQIITVFCK